MKLYVTIIEIDAAVYAHVDVDSEGNVPREIAEHKICQYHVARYVASGLYDAESPECKAWTVQSSDQDIGLEALRDYAANSTKENNNA